MQGRLSPPVGGKIQAFPWGTWDREFELVGATGGQAIEFILEADRWQDSPLLSAEGRERIAGLCRRHGVFVDTVCLDYCMAVPLWVEAGEGWMSGEALLQSLSQSLPRLGVKVVNLPLLGRSGIEDPMSRRNACEALTRLAPSIAGAGLTVALETSLAPVPLHEFLHQLGHPVFGVNYDTGNSAYFGHSIPEEVEEYGHHIYSVHIKDCRQAQPSVRLGTGQTDFESFFTALAKLHYCGPIVLQSARTASDPVEDVRGQVGFVRQWLKKYPLDRRTADSPAGQQA